MDQNVNFFPNLKNFYNRYVKSKSVDYVAHKIANLFTDLYSAFKGFVFPKKFTWEWKLEMLAEKYELNTTNFFKKNIKEGMVAVDIGAHIGYFTRIFSKLVGKSGKVYSFEAEKENFNFLNKNVTHFGNVKIFNIAVSNSAGTIPFYKIPGSTGCHSVVKPEDAIEATYVESQDLDSYFKKLGVERVDVIKIDIEGGETLAFQGMRKILNQKHIIIVTEINPEAMSGSSQTVGGLLDFLQSFDLTAYQITASGDLEKFDRNTELKFYNAKRKYTNIVLKK